MELHLTSNVYGALWEHCDTNVEKNGIVLAGKGNDGIWYGTTLRNGYRAFSFCSTEDVASIFIRDHAKQHNETQKIIPFSRNSLEGITASMKEKTECIQLNEFGGQELVQYFVFEENVWKKGRVYMVSHIDRQAERHIAELMDAIIRILHMLATEEQ